MDADRFDARTGAAVPAERTAGQAGIDREEPRPTVPTVGLDRHGQCGYIDESLPMEAASLAREGSRHQPATSEISRTLGTAGSGAAE